MEDRGPNKGNWQGQGVVIVRPAKEGDPDFDPTLGIGEQVIIKLSDGSEQTVARKEVETNPPST
jgi:hypothetical protein